MKAFIAGRLTRNQALTEGHKAIDDNQARIAEIARKHEGELSAKTLLSSRQRLRAA